MGPPTGTGAADLARWAASGAMALTGTPGRALGPPPGFVAALDAVAGGLRPLAGTDPLAVLGERAALAGLHRAGEVSCGGAGRLLPTADGWVAVTLARPDDIDAVPAWLRLDGPPAAPGDEAPWAAIAAAVAGRATAEVVERATLLDLPVAALGGAPPRPPVVRTTIGPADPLVTPEGLTVVDLTSLWAGPLCGDLLARAGATVIKVESLSRPDGARSGPVAFFDLLNGAKRSVAVDFATSDGAAALRALLARADVVLEASRPRALTRLGVDPAALLATPGGPRLWVSITGYGRAEPGANRVAFGDDAAVAGGLVVWEGDRPRFCADAVADPLAGLTATRAALDALAAGGAHLIDVAMAAVAASMVRTDVVAGGSPAAGQPGIGPDPEAVPPRARAPLGPAPALGVDTAAVLGDLAIGG